MSWDGKKAEPMQMRGYACAGCGKVRSSGGTATLERLAAESPILVHKNCRQQAIRRLINLAKEKEAAPA